MRTESVLVRLLIAEEAPDPVAPVTRVGGAPLAPLGATWPRCATCGGPLRFLAQVRLDRSFAPREGLLLAFLCPRVETCAGFLAGGGANHATVVSLAELVPMMAPDEPDTRLAFVAGARLETAEVEVDDPLFAYDEARERWGGVARQRQVLGRLGGPCGLIDHAPPVCACGAVMEQVVQLEEGPDHETAMNFAGGCGFAFVCGACDGAAAFLWE